MLSRAHRFHGLHSLDFVYKRGQTVRGPTMALKYVQNNRQEQFRVAVVVSKKVSKSAVQRNRIRRRVFEAARAELGSLNTPVDLVFTIYSADVAAMDAAQVQKQVKTLLHKASVVLY